MKWVSYIVVMLFMPLVGWAQSVNWSPANGTLEKGASFRLGLAFKDCDPPRQMRLPQVDGLDIGRQNSRQSHMSSLSGLLGGKGKTTTLGFPAVATKEGVVVIPSFTVSTSKGDIQVPEARYQVVKGTVTARSPTQNLNQLQSSVLGVDDIVTAKVNLDKNSLWEKEVVDIEVLVDGESRYFDQPLAYPEWQPQEFRLGAWQEVQRAQGSRGGESITRFRLPVRAQVSVPAGKYPLPAGTVPVRIRTTRPHPFFNRRQQVSEKRQLEVTAPEITVKALPEPAVGFSGAVGKFTITSNLVPEQAAIGEPVTWTIQLQGTGNWSDAIQLPDRQVPEGFEVIQPKSNTEMEDGSLYIGKLTEDVVLIPSANGTYEVPGVTFVYFDTEKGEYQSVKTEKKQLVVKEAVTRSGTSVPAVGAGKPQVSQQVSQAQVVPFDGQAQLPRDPLGYAMTSKAPWSLSYWIWFLLLPWAGVMGYWVWLAWRQVLVRDEERSRRVALKSLKSWQLSSDSRVSLPEWQRLVEALWDVSRPMPQSSQLKSMVNARGGDAEVWSWLWSHGERVLFGQEGELPEDWESQFKSALKKVRLPRVKWSGFFKPQVWLPVILGAFLFPQILIAQDGGGDGFLPDAQQTYQAGEFNKAEATLRMRLEKDWGDSAAHHDLALALFQQERWDEAAAHASIAALQSPSDEVLLWDVRLLTERAGWNSTVTGKFFDKRRWVNQIFYLMSVNRWQRIGLATSVVLALCVAWALFSAYRHISAGRVWRWIFVSLAGCVLLFSFLSVERWGMLRHPEAILVMEELEARSLPSEVDQQTRPLPVGTVGYFQQKFLGWRKVMLSNREEVWVREKDVLPIYP